MNAPTNAPHTGPLSGITVLDLATYVAGPLAAMSLADLGADVIKVEAPRGDPTRRFGRAGAVSPLFTNSNRGKRSICLDLKQPGDRDRLHGLLATADVVISNWRDEVAARLGIDDAALARDHPRLVRAYVTGFGTSGPLAGAPAFDGVLQAYLGITDAQGDEAPQLVRSYLVDKVTALMAAHAILAALVARDRTGTGDRIDISMLDAGAYFDFPDMMMSRTFVEGAPASPRSEQITANRPIRARDGWLVVAPVSGAQVRNACAAMGVPELAEEVSSMKDGGAVVARLFAGFEKVTADLPVAECVTRFASAGVPAGPCFTFDQHLADPQVEHNELYAVHHSAAYGAIRQVRYPARFAAHGVQGRDRAIPTPDEHRGELLTSVTDGGLDG